MASNKLVVLRGKASEIAREAGQFHVFRTFLQYFFWGSSKAILKAHFHESESTIFKPFFYKPWFWFWVFSSKCLKQCVNGVLKFQFFFLNLPSKIFSWCQSKNVKTSLLGHLCPISPFSVQKGGKNHPKNFWFPVPPPPPIQYNTMSKRKTCNLHEY